MHRRLWIASLLVGLSIVSGRAWAQSNEEYRGKNVSILSYGMDGLADGALVGLAAGYVATGPHFESGEWRKLVLGTGIGALVGVGIGITMAVVDTSTSGPGVGEYVLRDIGYGTMLGGVTGALVGVLFFVSSNHPKDIAVGASVGALVGAGVGVIFGVIEGASARSRFAARDGSAYNLNLSFTSATTVRGDQVIVPGVRYRF